MPVYYVNQDNDHIREIFDNLVENAIKYTPKGNVVVDITATDEKVIVSVKDSGLGIPPEDLPHLFQKFYRINKRRPPINWWYRARALLGTPFSRSIARARMG
jgi:signal transduction histidine kinase